MLAVGGPGQHIYGCLAAELAWRASIFPLASSCRGDDSQGYVLGSGVALTSA